MATQIKTRILNKYDLLANYSTFKPLKGEICIAEVTSTTPSFDGTKPAPIVGIKVGDGEHTFDQLPWIQAVAGDVTAEIKNLTGIADIDTKVAALAKGTRKLATAAELTALEEEVARIAAIAESTDIGNNALNTKISTLSSNTDTKLATKVDKSNAEEATSTDKLVKSTTVDSKINTAKSELNTAIQGVQTNLNNLAGEGNQATVKGNADAVAALDAKIGKVSYTGDSVTAAIAALQASIGDSSEGLGSQVAELNTRMGEAETAIGTKAAQSDLTALQGRVTTVENDLNTATTGLKDKVAAVEGKLEGIDTTVVAAISKSEETTNAKIKAITDDYLKAADKQALQTQIDTIMSNPDAEGAINSINEFTQYIEEHGEIAEGFRTDINALKGKVDTGDLTVSAYVSKALEDSNLDQYASAEALTGVSNRVKAIEDAPYATTANVATAKSEVIGASSDAKTADTIYGAKAYADDAAATAKSEAISTAASAADAKYELKNVAKGLVDALAGEGNTTTVKANAEAIVGINSTLSAMNVTDAVDGVVTKVDQANGKITVTHKKITMDEFDPDATFIFYCGTASDVAD